MKANAPKKLYVDIDDRLNDSFLYGFTERKKFNDIEYIRKDVFIEAVAEWLSMNLGNDIFTIPKFQKFKVDMGGIL